MKNCSCKFKSLLIFTIFLICSNLALEAMTTKKTFAKYPNKYFIESGSFQGSGIQMALDCGFKTIYSIEITDHYYQLCRNRFKNNANVKILQGNSINVLPKILESIDSPATFWLDGHYSWGDTGRGDTNTPILEELEAIGKHHIKTHTILIDDVRQFGTVEFDFIEIDEIKNQILKINPSYIITFEDGAISGDVLVARVPVTQ